jgi:hypothetical protein
VPREPADAVDDRQLEPGQNQDQAERQTSHRCALASTIAANFSNAASRRNVSPVLNCT